jgi:hypothetical protein
MERIPPNQISRSFTPEPHSGTPFLDHDLALALDHFPNFPRPRFMERAEERAIILSILNLNVH